MNSLPEQFNFAEHLFALNRARGDRIAYIDDQGTLSYSAWKTVHGGWRRCWPTVVCGARNACCC